MLAFRPDPPQKPPPMPKEIISADGVKFIPVVLKVNSYTQGHRPTLIYIHEEDNIHIHDDDRFILAYVTEVVLATLKGEAR